MDTHTKVTAIPDGSLRVESVMHVTKPDGLHGKTTLQADFARAFFLRRNRKYE
jgi:hypothetical protein